MGFHKTSATRNMRTRHARLDRCECRKVQTHHNGRTIYTYYDRYGNRLDGIPAECKGLWDLLNDD